MDTKPIDQMKVLFCLLMAYAGICTPIGAQTPLPTAGPSFSAKDTTKAAVIAIASLQSYPVGIDRKSTRQDTSVIIEDVRVERMADEGPIQDWHNPAGYMGSSRPPSAMTRHKPLQAKKYQRPKPNRCYTF